MIYYWAPEDETIHMLLVYEKGERDDLTADQEKALAALIRKEFK